MIAPEVEFQPGNQFYHGTSEFLVWSTIPGETILRTVSVQSLLDRIDADGEMSRVFRLHTFMTARAARSPSTGG